jgi:membrane protease YdiL (CAAX protease family)
MAALAAVPVRAWRRAAVLVMVGTVVLIAAPEGVLWLLHQAAGHDPGRWARWLIGVSGETGILLLGLGAARTIRDEVGSWQAALGLVRPTWRDLRTGLLWMLLELLARALVVGLFEAVLGRDAVRNASNLRVSGHHSVIAIMAALLVASVLAPAAEEVQCRGVLLRAGMAQWGFRRAALLSSLFFGVLHADQASSVAGAVVLSTNIAVFGYLQCVLVRRSGRLAPAMVAHGASNGFALWVALAG